MRGQRNGGGLGIDALHKADAIAAAALAESQRACGPWGEKDDADHQGWQIFPASKGSSLFLQTSCTQKSGVQKERQAMYMIKKCAEN